MLWFPKKHTQDTNKQTKKVSFEAQKPRITFK